MSRFFIALLAWALAGTGGAEVYRWVDEGGRVHYSNAVPPANATRVGTDARGGFASTVPVSGEAAEEQVAAAPLATAPAQPRGLEFRKYVSLQRDMTEGELLEIAGTPDLRRRRRDFDTYTYLPTAADPFVTTVTLLQGRVTDIARERRF